MNVAASETIREAWSALEGRLVNGVLPLRRYLGGSDHSAVFLSESTSGAGAPSQVALKLVPAVGALADSQLSLWFAASVLDHHHPHLLRLLDAGRCEVDGLHYVYAVMEYADQTLAQLLEHRALTQDEAREMLAPTLQALAYLHRRGLVQGRLKPSNILVVGDALKLASDTIRPVGEARDAVGTMSVYAPPEVRDGICSSAGDVWALGVTLCEALTRRQPSGLRDGGGRVVLPADLPAAFHELIERCVSRRPEDRPGVAGIEAWMRGESGALAPASDAALQPIETIALLEPAIPQVISSEALASASPVPPPSPEMPPVAPVANGPGTAASSVPPIANQPAAAAPDTSLRASQPATAVPAVSRTGSQSATAASAATIISLPAASAPAGSQTRRQAAATAPAVSSTARRAAATSPPVSPITARPSSRLREFAQRVASQASSGGDFSRRRALPLVVGAVIVLVLGWAFMRLLTTDEAPTSATTNAAAPPAIEAARESGSPTQVPSPTPARADPVVSTSEVHKEIPDVPRRARQTIRGTVRVAVRVIVNQDGTVFAALTEQRGPSRYFERLAVDASKKWTFTPAASEAQRIMIVRFAFTRGGTTARAVAAR